MGLYAEATIWPKNLGTSWADRATLGIYSKMYSIRFQLSYNAELNWLVHNSRVIDNVNTRVVPHYQLHLNNIK